MSKIKFTLTAIFLFIIAAILLLQIDDDLDPKAQQMFEQATFHKESKAYVYLLGMKATAGEEPEAVGKALMVSLREAEERRFSNPHDNQNFGYVDYPDEKKLPLPELDTCQQEESKKKNKCDYIDKLLFYPFNLESLPEEQKVLLERYRKVIAMKDFHTLSAPLIEAPLPSFQYVIKGNSLASLEAIAKAKNGSIENAKKQLLNEIKHLRIQLQQADTLITKMIFTSAITRTLDVLSVLVHQYDLPMDEKIPTLSIDEKSLVKAMNYEYAVGHNMFKALDRAPSFFSKEGNIPGWVVRLLFKPNMTLNATFSVLRDAGKNSLVTSKAFAQKVASNKPEVESKTNFRNYAGTVLGQIAGPDFNQYIARVFYLDAKIDLFNKTSSKTKLPDTLSHISNPFYENKTAYYSEDKKAICVDGPLLQKRTDYRCLRVK